MSNRSRDGIGRTCEAATPAGTVQTHKEEVIIKVVPVWRLLLLLLLLFDKWMAGMLGKAFLRGVSIVSISSIVDAWSKRRESNAGSVKRNDKLLSLILSSRWWVVKLGAVFI